MDIVNLADDNVFYIRYYTAEIIDWIEENTDGCSTLPPEPSKSKQNSAFIEFHNIEDAAAFKLRWI